MLCIETSTCRIVEPELPGVGGTQPSPCHVPSRLRHTWSGLGLGFGLGLGLGLDPGDAHCSTQPARGLARPGGLVGGRLVHEARELPRRRAEAEEAVA